MSLMSPYELKMKLDLADDRARFVKENSLPGAMKNAIVTDDGHMHFFDDDGNDITKSVRSIGRDAFWNCTSLTSIVIPDSVESIGNRAFSWCTSLTSIFIPDSVASIENGAFSWCTSLKSIVIPDSVTCIGSGAFNCCWSLNNIVFKGKTLEEVEPMHYFPWGVEDESVFRASDNVTQI